jgi:hypothetical protein
MDALRVKTLEEVDAALEIVESARANAALTPAEKLELEKAAVKLRNLERAIIKLVEKDMVSSLSKDSLALKNLSAEIKASSQDLAGVAATIAKAASVVESFIKIITSVAGIL